MTGLRCRQDRQMHRVSPARGEKVVQEPDLPAGVAYFAVEDGAGGGS